MIFLGVLGALAVKNQCLKCRIPVNTIAISFSSAAAITSSSRIDPPGCITAVIPTLAALSSPSLNGKNASDAITEPLTSSFACSAFMPAIRAELIRLICPDFVFAINDGI